MTEKIKYKEKDIVGLRQMYRRAATITHAILQDLHQTGHMSSDNDNTEIIVNGISYDDGNVESSIHQNMFPSFNQNLVIAESNDEYNFPSDEENIPIE